MEENNKTNVIAIVGCVLSFFTMIIGLVCSIIGLSKSKILGNGKGLSIAGIVISCVRIVLCLLICVFFSVSIKNVMDLSKHDAEKIDNKTKAVEILEKGFGNRYDDPDRICSYNYIGIYKDTTDKEYYVYDVKCQVNDDHLSSAVYYAVSIENNDYYFIMNSPEFLETGIVYLELKTKTEVG